MRFQSGQTCVFQDWKSGETTREGSSRRFKQARLEEQGSARRGSPTPPATLWKIPQNPEVPALVKCIEWLSDSDVHIQFITIKTNQKVFSLIHNWKKKLKRTSTRFTLLKGSRNRWNGPVSAGLEFRIVSSLSLQQRGWPQYCPRVNRILTNQWLR